MTPPDFLLTFPEFADTSKYLPYAIDMWFSVADGLLPADRWGSLRDIGAKLFVAHNLALGRTSTVSGAVASKSVSKASISYDTTSATIEGAGAYNATSYGRQFYDMARMIGMGGLQL